MYVSWVSSSSGAHRTLSKPPADARHRHRWLLQHCSRGLGRQPGCNQPGCRRRRTVLWHVAGDLQPGALQLLWGIDHPRARASPPARASGTFVLALSHPCSCCRGWLPGRFPTAVGGPLCGIHGGECCCTGCFWLSAPELVAPPLLAEGARRVLVVDLVARSRSVTCRLLAVATAAFVARVRISYRARVGTAVMHAGSTVCSLVRRGLRRPGHTDHRL